KGEFESNLKDADIEKAQDYLYNMMKEGLILNGWIGSASDCFNANCLFYAMGDWAYSGKAAGPKEGDNWEIVPIPAYDGDPQKITTSDMTAFMWVRGSEKNDAVKTWFECVRVAKNDPEYAEANKQKFMENNPYWTDEMYDVRMDVVSDDYKMIFDYAFGISSTLGDRKQFDGNQCLVDYLYAAASTQDENGSQPTWGSIREEYAATVESEVKDLNSRLAEYNAQ
ncbi:MAG: ABC transporter substrate-binding protein, partial [Oscillospiraceae bacterium]